VKGSAVLKCPHNEIKLNKNILKTKLFKNCFETVLFQFHCAYSLDLQFLHMASACCWNVSVFYFTYCATAEIKCRNFVDSKRNLLYCFVSISFRLCGRHNTALWPHAVDDGTVTVHSNHVILFGDRVQIGQFVVSEERVRHPYLLGEVTRQRHVGSIVVRIAEPLVRPILVQIDRYRVVLRWRYIEGDNYCFEKTYATVRKLIDWLIDWSLTAFQHSKAISCLYKL